MRLLFENPPLVTIYLCQQGGIHIVTHNVNVGMPLEKFHELNAEVQKALVRFETGGWPSPYIALTYHTTVICLDISDLSEFAEAMSTAAEFCRDLSEFGFVQAIDHAQCTVNQPRINPLPLPDKKEIKNYVFPLSPN